MIKLNYFLILVLSSLLLLLLLTTKTSSAEIKDDLFPVSIVHINDFHARFEESDKSGGVCDGPNCLGGYARTVHTVKELMDKHKDTNPIYLNAGDNFQGTLWYNIGRWNVTSQFLNMYPAEAMTLGNHEFDHGIEGVVPFLKHLKSPMLVANMDITDEPTLNGTFQKSMVIERSGRKIGLIGVILETTDQIANTGKLRFLNESDVIRDEAKKLRDEHNVNIIIVISHCGYEVDKIIAKNAGSDVDVIVGAHSHTFLYTGTTPPGPDLPGGDYPTEVIHESGSKVLIVQAGAYAKYVGDLTVWFNNDGNVVRHEGDPIFMSADVPQDVEVLEAIKPWKKMVDVISKEKFGKSRVYLEKANCSYGECNLGNMFTDALVFSMVKMTPYNYKYWTKASIGLTNAGNFRVSLNIGDLTYSKLFTMCPYQSNTVSLNLYGQDLRKVLEQSISFYDSNKDVSDDLLQVSGIKIVYDITKPKFKRIVDVKVLCQRCVVPIYENLQDNEIYRIVTTDWLAGGNSGYKILKQNGFQFEIGPIDIDVLRDYIKHHSPIVSSVEGRIRINK